MSSGRRDAAGLFKRCGWSSQSSLCPTWRNLEPVTTSTSYLLMLVPECCVVFTQTHTSITQLFSSYRRHRGFMINTHILVERLHQNFNMSSQPILDFLTNRILWLVTTCQISSLQVSCWAAFSPCHTPLSADEHHPNATWWTVADGSCPSGSGSLWTMDLPCSTVSTKQSEP